ncbi:hypothetical protein J5N97_026942 [Dioscorea zingiberensis]|uniref:Peptidase A1 domain-containing protein n=1 Tax=Dioscorea zingiberensis TaxID=325984 RepID=A0A9D5C4A7_9LILI|nr:hypothetical protein J5N97_026942 [Dioscorea zingiberensis]
MNLLLGWRPFVGAVTWTVEGTTILEMKLTKPREEDLMKFLASDDARVSSLQFRIRNGSNDGRAQEGSSSMEVQIPLSSGAKLSTLNYVVTVELGGRKMTVIVNTGSDLTWVQCKPCTSCYNQQDPVLIPLLRLHIEAYLATHPVVIP